MRISSGAEGRRVLAAMSGGVDSSVAAAIMVEAGLEVVGVTLKLWEGPNGEAPTAGCCTVSDAEDARRVADRLQIPYYVLDYTEEFRTGVLDRFQADYISGRTPNPCIECNRTVKFSRLLSHAGELECDLVVTGHYAQIKSVDDRWQLWRGVDRDKDQSYVLSMLTQTELSRLWFPVGEWDKSHTRDVADRWGFRNAHKPDSQDICFVGQGDYRDVITLGRPGPIVDMDGKQVGTHQGIGTVTIGQRRGLNLVLGEPHYVVAIEPDDNRVVVGMFADLAVSSIDMEAMSWVDQVPDEPAELSCQYRAHGDPIWGVWENNTFHFSQPQFGVAPGQTASFYRGDQVWGGGIIHSTSAKSTIYTQDPDFSLATPVSIG